MIISLLEQGTKIHIKFVVYKLNLELIRENQIKNPGIVVCKTPKFRGIVCREKLLLFPTHNVQNRLIGLFHTGGTDDSDIADRFFNIFFNNTVIVSFDSFHG